MRLVLCGMSAILLSGCSWLGFGGGGVSGSQYSQNSYGQNSYGQGAGYNQPTGYGMQNAGACQITSPTQRIPQGCRPEQVTLAVGGGQYGDNSAGQYTTGSYGSHAGNVQTSSYAAAPSIKKPKLRGTIGLELDSSISGTLYDPLVNGGFASYNSANFYPSDGSLYGTPPGGRVDQFTNFSSVREAVEAKTISFDDAFHAPIRLSAGLEYIFDNHNTVFANVGYTRAAGSRGGSAKIVETLSTDLITTFYDGAQDITGVFPSSGNTRYGVDVAKFSYDFSELKRLDVELGGRHYFKPMFQDQFERTLTPFVSGSAGGAHYSDITVIESQQQRKLGAAILGIDDPDGNYFNVNGGTTTVTPVSDAQWVPYGSLRAGIEWQMTPKTALAFEAGLKYEGAREFSNGAKGQAIVSVPVAIRGSYNF
ncbi:MAG: hypothetical protein COA43_12285 [Robiginitomaculum sp.]|nr:MAG: hypothetical protein COA43_12285 [Robiginitomaculum sp.]